MQNLPEVGKIYISRTDPSLSIYVEKIDLIEADEETEAGFCVQGCDPKHTGKQHADGIEIYSDEWISHGYHQTP